MFPDDTNLSSYFRLYTETLVHFTITELSNSLPIIPLYCVFYLPEPSMPLVKTSSVSKTTEAQDRSPIRLNIGDNVTALTNTSITIKCPISGLPTPTATWTRDGQKISSEGRYKVQDDSSLLINGANMEDNARYTCIAENVAGKDSASSTIQVLG